MIVHRIGYLNLEQVLKLKEEGVNFCIYSTNKGTQILVENTYSANTITLYYPKKDRLPWKTVEGKKIINGIKVFDSTTDINIVTTDWNNGNQIMAYKEFVY